MGELSRPLQTDSLTTAQFIRRGGVADAIRPEMFVSAIELQVGSYLLGRSSGSHNIDPRRRSCSLARSLVPPASISQSILVAVHGNADT
ncbi:unnamed protein product, partial [Iphiclides podalirius]